MNIDLKTFEGINRPMFVLEEGKLRRNLALIKGVAEAADVNIILAFKAYALWKTFPIFREYIHSTTASSLNEARLAYEEFGEKAHTYSPAYTDYDIESISQCSSHISFNSLSQLGRYAEIVKRVNPLISIGLRINPEYSDVDTALYNPCAPGTRFGVSSDKLPDMLPVEIDGFHCHNHCESGAEEFARTIVKIEKKFGKWLSQLKWINFGGGHLITRQDYNIPLLVHVLNDFHSKYPNLRVILEPGSAFVWHTGCLVSQVVDIVEDSEIRTAILNISFTCHTPDCLEMPYMPEVRGAEITYSGGDNVYRLGGNSCLSGDFLGSWRFNHELKVGEHIIFEDMMHYTTVKTNMFNGVAHPAIAIVHHGGDLEILREFTYDDYKYRMD